MNKKEIAKKIVSCLSSIIMNVRKTKKRKIKHADVNLMEIYPKQDIYSDKTFENEFSFNTVDLCLVVPFYNVKNEFLDKCLRSLIDQSTKYSYRIVCIDDGSKDDTYIQLLDYQKKYPSKIYVYHQENAGISMARNRGISLSNCTYIGFVDQDDWVEDGYIEILLNQAYEKHASVVKCSHKVVMDGKLYSEYGLPDYYCEGRLKNDLFKFSGMIWSGIYKRSIFDKVRFPECYWYEDMIARFLLYRLDEGFCSIADVLYVKRKHDQNASITVWKNGDIKCLDHLYLVESLTCECEKLNLLDEIAKLNVLQELSLYLMWRIRGLDKDIQMAAFQRASKLINSLDFSNVVTDKMNLLVLNAFKNEDFYGWKIISWKKWSVEKE